MTRIENHTPSPVSATDWLTVVSAGASVPDQVRLSTSDGNVTSGAAVGVLVLGSPNAVVLFSDDHAAAAQLSAVTYTVAQTAAADHVLIDVAPSTNGYAVTTTVLSGVITVNVQPGGAFQPTSEGTLAFTVGLDGTVTAAPAPIGGDSGVPVGPAPDAGHGSTGPGHDAGHGHSADAGHASTGSGHDAGDGCPADAGTASSGSTHAGGHAGSPDAGTASTGSSCDAGHRAAPDTGLPASDNADEDGSASGAGVGVGSSRDGGCSMSGGRPDPSDVGNVFVALLIGCVGARRRLRVKA